MGVPARRPREHHHDSWENRGDPVVSAAGGDLHTAAVPERFAILIPVCEITRKETGEAPRGCRCRWLTQYALMTRCLPCLIAHGITRDLRQVAGAAPAVRMQPATYGQIFNEQARVYRPRARHAICNPHLRACLRPGRSDMIAPDPFQIVRRQARQQRSAP